MTRDERHRLRNACRLMSDMKKEKKNLHPYDPQIKNFGKDG